MRPCFANRDGGPVDGGRLSPDGLRNDLVQLVFLAAAVLYIWFQSLFVQTSHEIVGDKHIFRYGWTGIILGFGFNVVPIGTACYLWRWRKDRVGAAIFLLLIPLFACFVMPQLLLERVEVTPDQLSHRREPPHTGYNADIAFADIESVVELNFENGKVGYRVRLKNGRTVELPANTVLTAARDTINTQLGVRAISVTHQSIRRESR